MKLSEIRNRAAPTMRISIEPAGGIYGEFEVDVEYDYEPASVTRHGDNSTFDERHSSSAEAGKAVLADDVDQYDEDGDKVIKTWKKGTDVTKLPGWTDKDAKWLQQAVEEKADENYASDKEDAKLDRYLASRDDY